MFTVTPGQIGFTILCSDQPPDKSRTDLLKVVKQQTASSDLLLGPANGMASKQFKCWPIGRIKIRTKNGRRYCRDPNTKLSQVSDIGGHSINHIPKSPITQAVDYSIICCLRTLKK
jgi:hypothetical protein